MMFATIFLGIVMIYTGIFWIVFFSIKEPMFGYEPKRIFWIKIGLIGALILISVGIYGIKILK